MPSIKNAINLVERVIYATLYIRRRYSRNYKTCSKRKLGGLSLSNFTIKFINGKDCTCSKFRQVCKEVLHNRTQPLNIPKNRCTGRVNGIVNYLHLYKNHYHKISTTPFSPMILPGQDHFMQSEYRWLRIKTSLNTNSYAWLLLQPFQDHYLVTSSMVFFLRSSYLSSISCTSFANWSFWFASRFSLCKILFPLSVTLVTSGSRARTSSDKAYENDNEKWHVEVSTDFTALWLFPSGFLRASRCPYGDWHN